MAPEVKEKRRMQIRLSTIYGNLLRRKLETRRKRSHGLRGYNAWGFFAEFGNVDPNRRGEKMMMYIEEVGSLKMNKKIPIWTTKDSVITIYEPLVSAPIPDMVHGNGRQHETSNGKR